MDMDTGMNIFKSHNPNVVRENRSLYENGKSLECKCEVCLPIGRMYWAMTMKLSDAHATNEYAQFAADSILSGVQAHMAGVELSS